MTSRQPTSVEEWWAGDGDDRLLVRDRGDSLADVLERVLDKGIVIVGDVSISLVDVELLTIKLRLLVASLDKAREMGIDWWEHDPWLSSRATERELEDRVSSLEDALDRARERRTAPRGGRDAGSRPDA